MGWRVLKIAALVLLVLLLLPYLVAPFYRVIDPPSMLIAWRRLQGAPVHQIWVPLSDMSPHLPLAVIVAEDGRYCGHHGIDFAELRAALRGTDDIEQARGVSTLSQQVAKNLFLWPGRSVIRKALEMPLAIWLDRVLRKRRLMEIYLNIAELGPTGEFGAEAGARAAFNKSVRDLSEREAALLAASLPNPARRLAGRPGPNLQRLAGLYERRMARSPFLGACVRDRGRPAEAASSR